MPQNLHAANMKEQMANITQVRAATKKWLKQYSFSNYT